MENEDRLAQSWPECFRDEEFVVQPMDLALYQLCHHSFHIDNLKFQGIKKFRTKYLVGKFGREVLKSAVSRPCVQYEAARL
jgi:hypothetical protein